MSVNVATWNVQGNLGSDRYSSDVWNGIDSLREAGTDVIVMPEAWWAHDYGRIDSNAINGMAERFDYTAQITPYESDLPQFVGHQHYLVTLRRPQVMEAGQSFELPVGRTDIKMPATDPVSMVAGEVYGLHFSSLNETLRLAQASSFLDRVQPDSALSDLQPIVALGDFNTMHPEDLQARLLRWRLTQKAGSMLPRKNLRDLANRLSQMSEGQAITLLEQAGFRDADPKHTATVKLGRVALVQLDHIMVNGKVAVEEFVRYELNGSDHLPVAAKLGFIAATSTVSQTG